MRERVGNYTEDKWNPPCLIVVEHRHGRVGAYQAPSKGPNDASWWVPSKLIQDLEDSGFKEARIQLNRQGPSMVRPQSAVQDLRPKEVIPVNRLVGESESNGRVEHAIRRVHEKARAPRHPMEENLARKVADSVPIMAWLVRWVAERIL